MYGGSKAGRGGGRGSGSQPKRSIHSSFSSSHLHRPVGVSNRLPGHRTTTKTAAPPPKTESSVEESFNLVTGNPLNFGMIVRLTPDLVDEIKKAEANGTTPRIRFDAHAHNTAGNVIDVGDKNFRFTWSREMGDLCDIYEERQSGEDGNGLLVESGCAWRKVNVQRELDESTKNHVKMRSEEAERKQKSRKAIKLDDHGNASQMKALAAAEANPWKMPFKQKKDSQPPFKKRRAEPPPAPHKSVHKSGFPSITPPKGRPSSSPLRFTPEQSVAQASPFRTMKTHANVEDIGRTQPVSKGVTTVPEKETPSRVNTGLIRDKSVDKSNVGTQPTDLRGLLISLLTENPKGMSLKALEKAVGDTFPSDVKKIEPIIKKIANYQTPGRYFLKPGVELEGLKKPSSQSGSSPEDNQQQTPALNDSIDQIQVPEPIFPPTVPRRESDEGAQLNSKPEDIPNAIENIDILFESPDPHIEKKNPINNERPAGSSSDSGSDSDSSDSGSDSGSRSKSKSSSSDSESDASSNSKEASDEDVHIMTSDDEKEPNPNLPNPWQTSNGDQNQDGPGSDLVDIENDDHEINTIKEAIKPFSPDRHEQNLAKEGSERKSKSKSKRVADDKQFADSHESAKRLKPGNVPQMSGGSLSPRPRDDFGSSKGYNQTIPQKSTFVSQPPKPPTVEKPVKYDKTQGDDGYYTNAQKLPNISKESPKDNYRTAIEKSPVANGRVSKSVLRRELSDLELGELRDETTIGGKNQFERKSSFKQSSSDYWNLDSNKGKAIEKIKHTPPNYIEGLSKKRTPEDNVEELTRPNHRVMPPQPQGGSHFNKSLSTVRGIVSHSTKENKKPKSSTLVDLREKQNNISVTDSDNGRQKNSDSSSDEIDSLYSKYEKEEPELKGPINDVSKYKEYVQEYLEKYDVYISVNEVLASYRDEFNKYKEEFEMAKGKDMDRYRKIEEKIKVSYRQCKTKHIRLKNIFMVLHEELTRLKEMIQDFVDSVNKD